MKKTIKVAILILMLVAITITSVQATTSSELANKLYTMGKEYGVTSAHKVQMERYLSDNPVTETEANTIVSKANEAIDIMKKAGTKDVTKLSKANKERITTIANEVAGILGVTLKFQSNSVSVYKDGKLIDKITATSTGKKLAYTGNNMYRILVVSSSIAIIALAIVCAKKKVQNA